MTDTINCYVSYQHCDNNPENILVKFKINYSYKDQSKQIFGNHTFNLDSETVEGSLQNNILEFKYKLHIDMSDHIPSVFCEYNITYLAKDGEKKLLAGRSPYFNILRQTSSGIFKIGIVCGIIAGAAGYWFFGR